MILLEPYDLEDLDSAQALDAVAADIRAHQATPDTAGFFTATRHTSFLAALLVALHGDALHHLDQDSSSERRRAGPLTACAAHVATALGTTAGPPSPSPPSPRPRPARWQNASPALSNTAPWLVTSTPPAKHLTRPASP